MRQNHGQALLIILLAVVVGLTIGLSLILRSVTNVRLSTEEQEAQKALAAAEAGIERVLKTGSPITADVNIGNNSIIRRVSINELIGNQFLISAGNTIQKDDGVDILFTRYPGYTGTPMDISNLQIYFGKSSDSCPNAPALEVVVVHNTVVAPRATRYGFDPCSRSNGFTLIGSGSYTVGGNTFKYVTSGIAINDGIVARVVPFYANTKLAVNGCNQSALNCPPQGEVIDSLGKAGSSERRVTAFKGYPKLPSEFFQYVLFAP